MTQVLKLMWVLAKGSDRYRYGYEICDPQQTHTHGTGLLALISMEGCMDIQHYEDTGTKVKQDILLGGMR